MMLLVLALGVLLGGAEIRLKPDTTTVAAAQRSAGALAPAYDGARRLKPALYDETEIARAIERAVVDRMGDVQVEVRTVSTSVKDRAGLVATIEPNSRLGQPVRFVLIANGTRVGTAVADVVVTGEAPRARRSLARDEEIAAGDVESATVEMKNVMLRRMSDAADVVGTRARRDIVAGELLTHALVVVPPAVRSGDEVRLVLTMGTVQVSGVGRASGSGQVGDVVRVTTPSSRKSLSARIIGRGAVEIVR
jgi:flagella basal body P-ring formation protein FlgA